MSDPATPSGRQKDGAKKMAAPRSGQVQGGNAQEGRRLRNPKIAIPRCSNMPKSMGVCKPGKHILFAIFPGKVREFCRRNSRSEIFADLVQRGKSLVYHWRLRDSRDCRAVETKDSREAFSQPSIPKPRFGGAFGRLRGAREWLRIPSVSKTP